MKKGFTLIELLVVVLIIGILAAVATTQYGKAVRKAQYAEVVPTLKRIYDAAELARFETGSYPADFDTLDFAFPSSATKTTCTACASTCTCYIYGKYRYTYILNDSVRAALIKDGADYKNYVYTISLDPVYRGKLYCVVYSPLISAANKTSSQAWCKFLAAGNASFKYNSADVYPIKF